MGYDDDVLLTVEIMELYHPWHCGEGFEVSGDQVLGVEDDLGQLQKHKGEGGRLG